MASTALPNGCDPIIRVWQRLAELGRMRLIAEPGPASATGWRGRAEAEVRSEPVAGGDRRLIERGRFWPAGTARAVDFHNVYRWHRRAEAIALSHERFGAEASVFLFDLVDDGRGRLVSRAAHRCGADVYAAVLSLRADGFTLDWTIRGPSKDERLYYHYQTGSLDRTRKTRTDHD